MNELTKPDPYTKIVLTVIAVCLVWLCASNVTLTAPAHARGARAVDQQAIDVRNVSLAELARTAEGEPEERQVLEVKIVGVELESALPVTVEQPATTPVTIVGVDIPSGWGPSNTLPVTFPSRIRWYAGWK